MGRVSAGTSPGREPRRPPLPAIVNGIGYAADPIRFIRWFTGRYGTVTSPRFPGYDRLVSIGDPELVRQVFTGDAGTFHSGEASRPVLEPTVGVHSVLTLDEEPHMRQRKLLLPPFHGANIATWGTRSARSPSATLPDGRWAGRSRSTITPARSRSR